jgi:DNA-binding IclR family transcriptional regulator
MAISFRVAEPEAKYLAELSERLGISQSEVLRRGLQAMAAQHLGAGVNAYALGADLFGGKATVADRDLSRTVSKRLRKLVREKRPA